MSKLIPFNAPVVATEAASVPAPRPATDGPHELSVLRGGAGPRSRATARPRRARRSWDPAFHVDLLQF